MPISQLFNYVLLFIMIVYITHTHNYYYVRSDSKVKSHEWILQSYVAWYASVFLANLSLLRWHICTVDCEKYNNSYVFSGLQWMGLAYVMIINSIYRMGTNFRG